MRLPRRSTRILAVLTLAAAMVATGGVPAQARTPVTVRFDQLPGPPWRVNQPAAVDGGVLTLGAYGFVGLFSDQPNDWTGTADNNLGWVVEGRMRLDPSVETDCTEEPARLWAGDHASVTIVGFGKGRACLTYPDFVAVPMDTQSAFHTYTLRLRKDRVRLDIDGRVAIDHTLSWPGGGTPALLAESLQGVSQWTHLHFDTTPSLPPCTITGTSGADRIVGGSGPDVICGGDGDDVLIGGGGADVLIGGIGDDDLSGGGGTDTLLGGYGDDRLTGGPGADTLYGGQGADVLPADAGNDGGDSFSGGADVDTADYSARPATAAVSVTLNGQNDDGVAGERDRVGVLPWNAPTGPRAIADVEQVIGGSGDDTLTGDAGTNTLTGGPGADTLGGLGGTDHLDGLDGASTDTLDGGDQVDSCVADAGDRLFSCNDRPPCVGPPGSPTCWVPEPPVLPTAQRTVRLHR